MLKRNLVLGVLVMGIAAFGLTPPDSQAKAQLNVYNQLNKQDRTIHPLLTSNSKLGEALPLWKITTNSIKLYGTTKLNPDLYNEPTSVLYPVNNQDSTILFMRMNLQASGNWVCTGIGFAQLAKEYNLIQQAWPASAGNTIVLVENEVLHSYLFNLSNLEQENLTPFRFIFENNPSEDEANISKYQALDTPENEFTRTVELSGGL